MEWQHARVLHHHQGRRLTGCGGLLQGIDDVVGQLDEQPTQGQPVLLHLFQQDLKAAEMGGQILGLLGEGVGGGGSRRRAQSRVHQLGGRVGREATARGVRDNTRGGGGGGGSRRMRGGRRGL